MDIAKWVNRARRAERAAHKVLSIHEAARSRVVLLEDLTRQLTGTPVDVQDYFQEAISCLEMQLYRAGIVTAWGGYFYIFAEVLYANHEKQMRVERQKWKFKDLVELEENYAESQIIDLAKDVKFISKAKLRVIQGQLSKRNQCAHPTLYKPTMNEAIGYVDEMIRQTIKHVVHTKPSQQKEGGKK